MYAFKINYDATTKNTNFYPAHLEYIVGKNNIYKVRDDNHQEDWTKLYTMNEAMALIDAYVRKPTVALHNNIESAERETNYGMWNVSVEMIQW